MDALSRKTSVYDADGEVMWAWYPDADIKSARCLASRRWRRQESPVSGASTK